MASFVLHHCMTARSFRPLWMMEELGLKYTLRMLPFPPRMKERKFLEENPLGTVPYFIDGDVKMTESSAICQYLVDKYGCGHKLTIDSANPCYGNYLNFLYMGEATLTFPQTLVLRYRHFEVGDRAQPQVANDYAKWYLARLKLVDQALVKNEYLCSNGFSAADISVGYALLIGKHLGLNENYSVRIKEYFANLEKRPGFQRAMKAQLDAAVSQGIDTTPAPDIRP